MPIPGPQHADARLGGMAAAWEKKLGSRGYWDRWPGWGMHAFGLWYARARWPAQLDATLLAADILQIARHRQTNGEVLQYGQCVPVLSAVAWLLGRALGGSGRPITPVPEAMPLGAQPLPRGFERAASKVSDSSTALDHPGAACLRLVNTHFAARLPALATSGLARAVSLGGGRV